MGVKESALGLAKSGLSARAKLCGSHSRVACGTGEVRCGRRGGGRSAVSEDPTPAARLKVRSEVTRNFLCILTAEWCLGRKGARTPRYGSDRRERKRPGGGPCPSP